MEGSNTKKITGSKRRKMSSSFPKVDTHNSNSTKPSSSSALGPQDSREKSNDVIDSSVSSSLAKHSTSSASSCIPPIIYNSASHPNGAEKTWDDSGLESASVSPVSGPVSPVSGPRPSDEETDSASSCGSDQIIPHTRNTRKKRFHTNNTKASNTKRRRTNSNTR